jgi:hypothetical protein
MTATRKHSTNRRGQWNQAAQPKTKAVLYVALELSWNEWKLAFATGPGDNPRLQSVRGRDTQALVQQIAKAKKRFGLPDQAPVHSCYEAGRDGFWLHRFLEQHGINNSVVDSASIEVKRRRRQRQTDRLDAGKLVSMLIRWHQGEQNVWSVVQVPSVADEDRRQLHRDLLELKAERTQHTNRIKGLLAGCGLTLPGIDGQLPQRLAELRTWDGRPVAPELQQRLLREHQCWQLVDRQINDLTVDHGLEEGHFRGLGGGQFELPGDENQARRVLHSAFRRSSVVRRIPGHHCLPARGGLWRLFGTVPRATGPVCSGQDDPKEPCGALYNSAIPRWQFFCLNAASFPARNLLYCLAVDNAGLPELGAEVPLWTQP